VEAVGLEPTIPCLQTKPKAVHDSLSSSVDVSDQEIFSDTIMNEMLVNELVRAKDARWTVLRSRVLTCKALGSIRS